MTVALGDAAILIVDAQARFLVAADLPTLVDRLVLGVVVTGRALRATGFDVPAAAQCGAT